MLAYLSLLNPLYDLRFLSISHSENVFRIEIMIILACERCFIATAGNTSVLSWQAMIFLERSGTLLNIRFSKILVITTTTFIHIIQVEETFLLSFRTTKSKTGS